jgi:hypothetical protein
MKIYLYFIFFIIYSNKFCEGIDNHLKQQIEISQKKKNFLNFIIKNSIKFITSLVLFFFICKLLIFNESKVKIDNVNLQLDYMNYKKHKDSLHLFDLIVSEAIVNPEMEIAKGIRCVYQLLYLYHYLTTAKKEEKNNLLSKLLNSLGNIKLSILQIKINNSGILQNLSKEINEILEIIKKNNYKNLYKKLDEDLNFFYNQTIPIKDINKISKIFNFFKISKSSMEYKYCDSNYFIGPSLEYFFIHYFEYKKIYNDNYNQLKPNLSLHGDISTNIEEIINLFWKIDLLKNEDFQKDIRKEFNLQVQSNDLLEIIDKKLEIENQIYKKFNDYCFLMKLKIMDNINQDSLNIIDAIINL